MDKSTEKGEWPLNLPIYIRLFGGTNGGLSTNRHKPGNLVCAIDVTSQVPYLKGYPDFIARNVSRFTLELGALFHLGKSLPKGIVNTDPDYKMMIGIKGVITRNYLVKVFMILRRYSICGIK